MFLSVIPFSELYLKASAVDSRVEQAVQTAIAVANDNSHGYSQSSRWGPDYDCSSLVYYAFSSAGFSFSPTWFDTRNMGSALINAGFVEVTNIDLSNSNSLQRGDILWKSGHTEIYIGNNQLVGAHSDRGYPQTGDQPGNEISVEKYYYRGTNNTVWTKVYRYENYTSSPMVNLSCKKVVPGNEIVFSFDAIGATSVHLYIYKNTDKLFEGEFNTNDAYTRVFYETGHYSCCIIAHYGENDVESVWVGFDVVNAPEIKIHTNPIYLWQDVSFELCAPNASRVGFQIYHNYGEELYYTGELEPNTIYTRQFGKIGQYSCVLTAYYDDGSFIESEWLGFYINDNVFKISYYNGYENDIIIYSQSKYVTSSINLSKEIPSHTGHSFKEWNTKPNGTGVSYQPGDIYSENADLTLYAIWELDHKHEYISEVTQQPTCTEKGIKVFTCSLCDDVYYEDVDELGHNYISRVTEPTCTSQGFTTYECSRCDDSYTENYIDPFNHSSSSWHTAINPTATSEGLAEKRCDYCGIVLDQFTIPCLAPYYVTGITLSSEKETVEIGDTFILSATVVPDTAKNKNIIWSSRNPEIVSVNNGKVTAIKPGTTAIVAETEDGGYIDFCLVRVISLVAFNGAVIDNDRNIIYGLSSNLESVDDYLKTADDSMTVTLSTSTVGTGTFINVMDNGEVVDLYEAVVFGDVNGDSWYDGQDAVIVSCLANGLLTKDDVSEAVYIAADCNHDGAIDQLDVDLLNQAGTLLANVDQSKSTEVLLETSSDYVEYISLIDQSPEIDDDTEDTPEPDVETEDIAHEQNAKIDIFEKILNFLKLIFETLLAYIPVTIK